MILRAFFISDRQHDFARLMRCPVLPNQTGAAYPETHQAKLFGGVLNMRSIAAILAALLVLAAPARAIDTLYEFGVIMSRGQFQFPLFITTE